MDEGTARPSMAKLFLHRGIYFMEEANTPEEIDALEHFPIRDTDVFLITYPKSGTAWTQQILCSIYHEGHLNKTENIKTVDRMPWIEYKMSKVDMKQIPSPRLLTTHLPHYLVPKGLRNKKAKIIYVTRNPKDNMVSYYHFGNMMRESIEEPTVMLEEHFEKYCTGKVVGGSWFDHVKGWHTHKDDFNILFLHYEDMMKDLRGAILKISRFVGKDLDEKTVDAIVERATFKNMKNDPLSNYENVGPQATKPPINKINFLRNGTVGDWKNFMTVAQNEKFDKIFQEKMKDVPIKFIWDIKEN